MYHSRNFFFHFCQTELPPTSVLNYYILHNRGQWQFSLVDIKKIFCSSDIWSKIFHVLVVQLETLSPYIQIGAFNKYVHRILPSFDPEAWTVLQEKQTSVGILTLIYLASTFEFLATSKFQTPILRNIF